MSSHTERMTNDKYRNNHFLHSIESLLYSTNTSHSSIPTEFSSLLSFHFLPFPLLLFLLILAILICPFHLHTSFLALPLHCFSSIDPYRNPSVLPSGPLSLSLSFPTYSLIQNLSFVSSFSLFSHLLYHLFSLLFTQSLAHPWVLSHVFPSFESLHSSSKPEFSCLRIFHLLP